MRRGSRPLSALLALAISTASFGVTPAFAQASSADRATARQLGIEGEDALSKKDYKTAEDKFKRADALYHALTLTLGLARAQAANGQLVAAQENYNRIISEGAPPGSPTAFVKAVEDARKEVDDVAGRVSQAIITVTGLSAADTATVTLDDTPFPNAALGVKRPVDPGEHVVKATAKGYKSGEAHFTVASAAEASATIALEVDPNAAAATTPPTANGTEPPPVAPGSGKSINKTIGYAALGVGAAGVVVGSIFGIIAIGKHGTLADACTNGCPSSEQSDLSSYHTMGTVSTIGFIVGGVGLAAGAVLILTAPKAHADVQIGQSKFPSPTISPYVGPGSAGVVGRF